MSAARSLGGAHDMSVSVGAGRARMSGRSSGTWLDVLRRGAVSAFVMLLGVCGLPSEGADKPRRVKYQPPEGFAGRTWGELRNTFERLPQEPVGVGAAYIVPKEKSQAFSCVPGGYIGPRMNGPYESCNWQATLDRIGKTFHGGGFYVLSEYSIPDQGFRWGDERTGVVIHPVVYQFCANYQRSRKKLEPPPNFDTINRFCGMRLMFQSETLAELAQLPADHVTVYDRMLALLRARFGPPAHFMKRGQVIIETVDGDLPGSTPRKFSLWRWCPASYGGFQPDCTATVTLSIDPATGEGMVLYSTKLLWEYAYARENNGFPGDWLFRVLHAVKK